MPDRVTNTMQYINPTTKKQEVLMRPTVINCYNGKDLNSMTGWWDHWKEFMFHTSLPSKDTVSNEKTFIYQMIPMIDRNKYPALTEEEESISKTLAIFHLALFDSILVHMMNTIDKSAWQDIRSTLCNNLNLHKNDRTIEILESSYSDMQLIFLQETSNNFYHSLTENPNKLNQQYDIYRTEKAENFHRDQNSIILLKKQLFINVQEVSAEVIKILSEQLTTTSVAVAGNESSTKKKKKLPIDDGDFFAIKATNVQDHGCYLFASFHGDTNGLATIPMVKAMHSYATNMQPQCKLLFGLDANSHAHPEKDQLGVLDFAEFFSLKKLNSCYGSTPNPLNFTTFHARTHLQPQLNKAVTLEEKDTKGDKNPKDFILFFDADFEVITTMKDNTGDKKYVENMVFPTLKFPSDHGITSTLLRIKPSFDGSSKPKSLRNLSN